MGVGEWRKKWGETWRKKRGRRGVRSGRGRDVEEEVGGVEVGPCQGLRRGDCLVAVAGQHLLVSLVAGAEALYVHVPGAVQAQAY
ncbi:unnamed protein product, partial [Iphiclides podalirius]